MYLREALLEGLLKHKPCGKALVMIQLAASITQEQKALQQYMEKMHLKNNKALKHWRSVALRLAGAFLFPSLIAPVPRPGNLVSPSFSCFGPH